MKLADKTCNLRDIAAAPPAEWSLARRQQYFNWAKKVVDGLPKVNAPLLRAFEDAWALRPVAKQVDPANRDGHWLSMPGPTKGTSGLVRVRDTGAIEIELYDHSAAAESLLGRELSTIYTVRKEHLTGLAERLAFGFGSPVPSLADLPEQLTTFVSVQSLIDWLVKDSDVPFEKRVDFDV